MKDAFFRWWQKVSDWVYVLVTGFTYFVYSHRHYKGAPALSREEKNRIRQYWKKNYGKTVPLQQYAWFKAKGVDPDPRFIPDTFWHTKVEPYFTNVQMEKGFCDKNYFETIVGRGNSPETLCRCIDAQLLDGDYKPVDKETACCILRQETEIICKPSVDSGGGRSIRFLSREAVTPDALDSLIRDFGGNFIVQKIVKQHAFMNRLNADSLNTMRITTFLYKGEIHLLYCAIRFGSPGKRLDNVTSGGGYTPLSKDGRIMDPSVLQSSGDHDLGDEQLQVPSWQEVMQLTRKLHYKLAHFQIIHWDVALRADGTPIIIEYNLIDSTPPIQRESGPVFGDMTDVVLQELASGRNHKHGKNRS